MTTIRRLRTPLLLLAIVLAAVCGGGGSFPGSLSSPTLADGPGIDRVERHFQDGRLALRAFELVQPVRHMGVIGGESTFHGRGAAHRPVAAAIVAAPSVHSAHLVLLTHQRNDLDA